MSRIADKHGLTNKYREPGMKRVVKRGRPRKYLLNSDRKRSSTRKKVANKPINQEINPRDAKLGFAVISFVIILIIIAIVALSSRSNNN